MVNLKNKLISLNTASLEKSETVDSSVKGYYATLGGIGTVALSTSFVCADALGDMFNKFGDTFNDIYKNILGISTIAAVVVVAVALIIKMFTKDERAAAQCNSWIKRTCMTWLILNALKLVVDYGKDLTSGQNYTYK